MEKILIEVLTLSNKENIVNGSLASGLILQAYKKGIVFPKNTTNGDIIKVLFPAIEKYFCNIIDLKLWWNAPYKVGDTDG